MEPKKNILFVCTVNRMRSATAHEIYKTDPRFNVNSAGTDKSANQVITQELLDWSETVIVMEKYHRNVIRKQFPKVYETKKIVCLYIPDEYDFMQKELITILKNRFEVVIQKGLI